MDNMTIVDWAVSVAGLLAGVWAWYADRKAKAVQTACDEVIRQEAERKVKADWDLRPVRIAEGMAVLRFDVEQAHRRQRREALQRHLADSRSKCLGCETEMPLNWQGIAPVSLPSFCSICAEGDVLPMEAPVPAVVQSDVIVLN